MTSTHDAADLTSSLLDWVRSVRPDASVQVADSGAEAETTTPKSDRAIMVRLVRLDGTTGPRSGDAVSSKLQLEYEFDVAFADPIVGHQALADLAFALLERNDLGERGEKVRSENGALSATFVLHRRRDLPRAKPVRETKIDLHPQAWVAGFVRAENGFPIARARLQVRDSDRLFITGNDGGFAFSAPEGMPVRATISAKGRTADVELRPGDPNIITLAMEP
jgi:hypothetical protein